MYIPISHHFFTSWGFFVPMELFRGSSVGAKGLTSLVRVWPAYGSFAFLVLLEMFRSYGTPAYEGCGVQGIYIPC